MNKLPKANTLYCFSPPVMIFTIIVELSLAVWMLSRYTIKTPQRIVFALLVFLAAFQVAEFNVCTSQPIDLIWSRLGYTFITILPALALDLVIRLRGNRLRYLANLGYGLAVFFILAFSFLPSTMNVGVCNGNYVVFFLTEPLSKVYGLYYLGLELIGLNLSIVSASNASKPHQIALKLMGLAYLSIMLPSFIIYFVLPSTRTAIPSIMCGFAIFFALIVGLKVTPLISKKR